MVILELVPFITKDFRGQAVSLNVSGIYILQPKFSNKCTGKGKERKRARAIALVLFRAVKRHEILPLLNAEAVFCEVTAFLYVNK